jgi:hypothetical protein
MTHIFAGPISALDAQHFAGWRGRVGYVFEAVALVDRRMIAFRIAGWQVVHLL